MKTRLLSLMLLLSIFLTLKAQNPEELPLFNINQLTYSGAFRMSASSNGVSDLNYSQGPIAYNAKNHSLFIVGHAHQQAIAEYAIPDLVESEVLSDLIMVTEPIQVFSKVLNKATGGNPEGIDRVGGLYVVNESGQDRLIVNAYEYYDAPADNTLTTLILDNANDIENATANGYYKFNGGAGHTSGWLSTIPTNWQEKLGGTHITGQSSGIPIISRASVGPSAFAFNMQDLLNTTDNINTVKLLDFSLTNRLHDDLSNETLNNDIWTHLSRSVYGFVVPGTRTYLTIGNSGGHSSGVCYKCTQDNGNLCGGYCTPVASDNYQYYWLWDLKDLIAVKNGVLEAHEVYPYDYGLFSSPFQAGSMRRIGGGSFDPITGNLYLSIQKGDTEQGTYARPPVIVVYKVDSEALSNNEPVIDEIMIYPNPTSDNIFVSGLYDTSTIRITDVIGKTIKIFETNEKTAEIDLSTFASGTYFISIRNEVTQIRYIKKIIKKE